MARHAKPRNNMQKFMSSPFMYLVSYVGVALMFGYTIASAI